MTRLSLSHVAVIVTALTLSACQTVDQSVLESTKSPVELRSVQSRIYETKNTKKVYRSIISVMQDLGYSIKTVEPDAGLVTGNKLAQLDLTATVRERDEQSVRVRANAIVKVNFVGRPTQVDSAEFYQQRFFEPLSKALFLDALLDEDPVDETDEKADGETAQMSDQSAADTARK